MGDAAGRAPAAGHGEAHRLLRGTLAIQLATIVSIVAFVVVSTVLGRRLTLAEFGVYGLTLSLTAYVAFIQASVENAAIRAMAQAATASDRDRAFTITACAYAGLGVVGGILIAAGGTVVLGLFNISADLLAQGRRGLVALGVLVAAGWTLRVFHDTLHGMQRFAATGAADAVGYAAFAVAVCSLALSGAPLWEVIAAGGTPMLFSGVACGVAFRRARLGMRIRWGLVDRRSAREFAAMSGYSLAASSSDVIVYQLDRAILGIFTRASTIGLYEAVVRPQLLLRQLHGTLSATVLPASAAYLASDDETRTRELALRGTRYVLAAVVPLTLFVTIMSAPLLEVWLGSRYLQGRWALSVFAVYWVFGANTGVLASMLFAHGGARVLAGIAWAIAGLNLALSLALTPLIGLNGVVAATTGAYALVFPFLLRTALRRLGIPFAALVSSAWRPVYPLAATLAVGLIAVRVTIADPYVALGVSMVALAAWYVAFAAGVLSAQERGAIRSALSPRSPPQTEVPS